VYENVYSAHTNGTFIHIYDEIMESLTPAGRDGGLITWKPCIFSYMKIIIN
jgi:hypothetical protein